MAQPNILTIRNLDGDLMSITSVPEHTIRGQMLRAEIKLNMSETLLFNSEDQFRNVIKQKLASEIAVMLLKNNLVNFTVSEDVLDQCKVARAYCFITPNDHTSLLRKAGYK